MRTFLPLLTACLIICRASAEPPAPPNLGPALTAAGAKVGPTYFWKEPVLQLKADEPLPEAAWAEIAAMAPKAIGTTGKGIDDAAVARFAKLPLEVLYLDGSSMTEAGWSAFKEMRQLKKMSVGHNQLWKGTGAAALANHPSLTIIGIGGTTFGDAGMPAIASIKQLQTLSLNHSAVTDAGIAALANHPALETLKMSPQMTPRFTDECLKSIATLPALKDFTIGETVLTYDGGLKLLKTLPHLQKLTLDKVGLSEDDLAKLKADLPKVEVKFTPAAPEAIERWRAQFEKMKAAKAK